VKVAVTGRKDVADVRRASLNDGLLVRTVSNAVLDASNYYRYLNVA